LTAKETNQCKTLTDTLGILRALHRGKKSCWLNTFDAERWWFEVQQSAFLTGDPSNDAGANLAGEHIKMVCGLLPDKKGNFHLHSKRLTSELILGNLCADQTWLS
jgi:hypothetical protein